jgi:hypothetical protein
MKLEFYRPNERHFTKEKNTGYRSIKRVQNTERKRAHWVIQSDEEGAQAP